RAVAGLLRQSVRQAVALVLCPIIVKPESYPISTTSHIVNSTNHSGTSPAMSDNRQLLIVAHAPSPNTRRLAEAVLRGARHPDVDAVDARWIPPLEAGVDDVLTADAIVLGTTENLGYMSGALKDFFDRIYYPCLDRTQGL